jgi:hypothetical protein
MVANAAFPGSSNLAVQHAVTGEIPHGAVIQLDGETDSYCADRRFEELDETMLELR